MFKAITERLNQTDGIKNQGIEELKEITEEHSSSKQSDQDFNQESKFLKSMLKHVRLPLINMRQLVTDIKFSGFFEDSAIFEAL